MRKLAMVLSLAVATLGLAPMVAAQAVDCSNGTVLQSTDGNPSSQCDVVLSVTVPSAASLTFTSVPSTNFGSVLPGTSSSPIAISYTVATNTGNPVTLNVTHSGAASNQALFNYKQNGGSYCNLDASCPGVISSALAAGAHTDNVQAVIPAGKAAGTYTATLTYQIVS